MATQNSTNILLVEGVQDKWFFEKFLQTYCADLTIAVEAVMVATPQDLGDTHDTKQSAIRQMKIQLQSLDKPVVVGLILDADFTVDGGGASATLDNVLDVFSQNRIDIQNQQAIGLGYLFHRTDGMPASGLWIMKGKVTDNDGQFEDWLLNVLDKTERDDCFAEAQQAVAASQFKKFETKQTIKAEVLTWLAWQKKPSAGLNNLFAGRNQSESLFDEQSAEFTNLINWLTALFQTKTQS